MSGSDRGSKLVLAAVRAAGVAPPRTQQGQQFDGTPEQGAAQGQRRMDNDSAHHHGSRNVGVFGLEEG